MLQIIEDFVFHFEQQACHTSLVFYYAHFLQRLDQSSGVSVEMGWGDDLHLFDPCVFRLAFDRARQAMRVLEQ